MAREYSTEELQRLRECLEAANAGLPLPHGKKLWELTTAVVALDFHKPPIEKELEAALGHYLQRLNTRSRLDHLKRGLELAAQRPLTRLPSTTSEAQRKRRERRQQELRQQLTPQELEQARLFLTYQTGLGQLWNGKEWHQEAPALKATAAALRTHGQLLAIAYGIEATHQTDTGLVHAALRKILKVNPRQLRWVTVGGERVRVWGMPIDGDRLDSDLLESLKALAQLGSEQDRTDSAGN